MGSSQWKSSPIKLFAKYQKWKWKDVNGCILQFRTMATLDPFLLTPSRFSADHTSRSKKSISIFESRQVIADFENTSAPQNQLEGSLLLVNNRQVTSGMILDVNIFDENSKVKKHLLAKNGENDENIFFSFLVLSEEDGQPREVIYRWVKKLKREQDKSRGIVVTEQEHVYKGSMRNNRKHGDGEYFITKKLTNATEQQTRYKGVWTEDIFSRGTVQDENGVKRELNNSTFVTMKSKHLLRGKSERNETIKFLTQEMEKKRSTRIVQDRNSNASCASILDKMKEKVENSSKFVKF